MSILELDRPRTAASVEKLVPVLQAHEPGTDARKQARRIRAIWKAVDLDTLETLEPDMYADAALGWYDMDRDALAQWMIDRIVTTYGVEHLGGYYKPTGEPVFYCNAGDPYRPTVLFIGRRLVVACWGDLVERGQIQE